MWRGYKHSPLLLGWIDHVQVAALPIVEVNLREVIIRPEPGGSAC